MNSVDEQANRLTETLGQAFLSHRITLDDCRRIVAEVLKTARQEALRDVLSDLDSLHWKEHWYADQLRKKINDRLASEGG